jgi:hypothetical protein
MGWLLLHELFMGKQDATSSLFPTRHNIAILEKPVRIQKWFSLFFKYSKN